MAAPPNAISVATNVVPVGRISAKKFATNGMNAPMMPAAANPATSAPRQLLSGRATRASTNTPIKNRIMALVARKADRSASLFTTSQPMTFGRVHEASNTDSAVAMPPGSANVTTRLRNPGI